MDDLKHVREVLQRAVDEPDPEKREVDLLAEARLVLDQWKLRKAIYEALHPKQS